MGSEPVSQQNSVNATPARSSPLKFFSSLTQPSSEKSEDPHKAWTVEYLTELRLNRPARPSGSRPLPNRYATTTPTSCVEPSVTTSSAMPRPSCSIIPAGLTEVASPKRSISEIVEQRSLSALSMRSNSRPIAQQPHVGTAARDFTTSTFGPRPPLTPAYFERGDRWMEKQEARSLRIALENMDLQEEERIHAAAQDEASDLVWKHQNPEVPYKNPHAPYDYRAHLRQGSHARSQGTGRYGGIATVRTDNDQAPRSASDGSTSSTSAKSHKSNDTNKSRVSSGSSTRSKSDNEKGQGQKRKIENVNGDDSSTTYMDLAFPVPPKTPLNRQLSTGSRPKNINGGMGKGLFRNPDDQIYEEHEEVVKPVESEKGHGARSIPLQLKDRNPATRPRGTRDMSTSSASKSAEVTKKLSSYEIHQNPPSQSRNPAYLQNNLPLTPPDSTSASDSDIRAENPSSKGGVEIRSDEIQAATRMRIRDRSPKLPTPTVVSDQPGRPIVSFEHDYKPREKTLKQERSSMSGPTSHNGSMRVHLTLPSKPKMPSSTASAPVIPTIHVPEPPMIRVNGNPQTPQTPQTPAITISDSPTVSISTSDFYPASGPDSSVPARPLPSLSSRAKAERNQRPIPHHSSTTPIMSTKPHWTPSTRRATAQCAACALPISGRVVSAAAQRFHPACFSCFQCGELLECVAFYPEPDTFRAKRLARINARLNNELTPKDKGINHTEEEDGDDSLRFFCHLDFHEKYSPRCRSCKTPIEGEVVVACGGEWHVGHFFCAECGDPFSASMPFVEKDGYAWCVDCHSKRFSGKCAGCRRPIVDTVIKALGREWHEGCFCCKVGVLIQFLQGPVREGMDWLTTLLGLRGEVYRWKVLYQGRE